jgi:uncharacterized membrane-anchored protein
MIMLNKSRRAAFLVVLALAQIAFLAIIAGSTYAASRWGQEIRIRTAPVDPRDMVYGDYVTLNYDISSLPATLWQSGGPSPKRGESVYVVLKKSAADVSLYDAAALYRFKPSTGSGEVAIRGRVDYSFDDRIRVRYGIEKYYVPENTGKALEHKAGRLIATVDVAPWGQAVLDEVSEETGTN